MMGKWARSKVVQEGDLRVEIYREQGKDGRVSFRAFLGNQPYGAGSYPRDMWKSVGEPEVELMIEMARSKR